MFLTFTVYSRCYIQLIFPDINTLVKTEMKKLLIMHFSSSHSVPNIFLNSQTPHPSSLNAVFFNWVQWNSEALWNIDEILGILCFHNYFYWLSVTVLDCEHNVIYKNKKFWEELIACFPWYDMDHIENVSNNSSVTACLFNTTVTFLVNHCLATIREYTYRHTDWWEGFLKYAVKMGSIAMIYISSFMKTGSVIQKLMGWGDTQTHR
jgi:hypothetical protein